MKARICISGQLSGNYALCRALPIASDVIHTMFNGFVLEYNSMKEARTAMRNAYRSLGEDDPMKGRLGGVRLSTEKYNLQGVELTAAEAIKLHAMLDWYWKLYKEEMDVFHSAFVMKHNIYRFIPEEELPDPTDEDLERHHRAQQIAMGMQDKSFQNRIESAKD